MCSSQTRHLSLMYMIYYAAVECSLRRKHSSTQPESQTFSFSYTSLFPGHPGATHLGPRNRHAELGSVICSDALNAFSHGRYWIKSFKLTCGHSLRWTFLEV